MILDITRRAARAVLYFLFAFVLVSCEQERDADISELHPFAGEVPVLFAFLQEGSDSVEAELYHTVPYLDTAFSASIIDAAEVTLVGTTEELSLADRGQGIYVGSLQAPIRPEDEFYLSVWSDQFGEFRSQSVAIPPHSQILGFDTVTVDSRVNIEVRYRISAQPELSYSTRLIRYGEGSVLTREVNTLPVREAEVPIARNVEAMVAYQIGREYTVFDTRTKVPVDTIKIDSAKIVLYTWGEEVRKYIESVRESGQEIGDGTETIDEISWSNIEGGYGVCAGFATDTVTVAF